MFLISCSGKRGKNKVSYQPEYGSKVSEKCEASLPSNKYGKLNFLGLQKLKNEGLCKSDKESIEELTWEVQTLNSANYICRPDRRPNEWDAACRSHSRGEH